MRKLLTLSSCIAALLIAAPVVAQTGSVEELRKTANTLFKPIPPKVTEVRGQKITQEQIDLGRMLYFDPRLSRSHIISCNTCHAIGTGGADNVPTSVGHGWQKGPRNAPTTLNAVFNVAQF